MLLHGDASFHERLRLRELLALPGHDAQIHQILGHLCRVCGRSRIDAQRTAILGFGIVEPPLPPAKRANAMDDARN